MIRVLIADNNVELCQTLNDFLDNHDDIDVIGIAYDGEEALEMISNSEPDVVILDITMPHLDGMAVLERMHTLGLADIPRIIVLTALSRDDLIHRFTELGADYFIVKPFDLDLLAERIRQFSNSSTESDERKQTKNNKFYNKISNINAEAEIAKLLQEMGMPAHFKGYSYLRDAVLLVLEDDNFLGGSLTKKLYPKLAEKYDSTPGGVEAAIRNAVLAAWENGNKEFLKGLMENSPYQGRFPTNSVVIAKLVDRLRWGGNGST